ncbi:MAG: trigger factor [Aeromicrobium sp.]
MKSTTENLSPTRVKLTIQVPFEEFKPSLDAAYKTIGAQITIPGFRKGKVPAAIVDQRVGRSAVLDEAINSALPSWYGQAIDETKIRPMSQPEIDLTKFVDGEDIEITAEIDVRPEITLPDISKIEVTVEDAVVTDEDVDEQLSALRDRFATFKEVDRAAVDGDFLTIDLSASKDGEKIGAAQAEGMPYQIGKALMLDGLDEALIGLKAGESKTFKTKLAGGELAGEEVDVEVTVTEVKEQELPELDDDFAQTASEFDTVAELRIDVTERVTRGKRI